MQVTGGGSHVHHHGLLSGLGAGAVAVLAVFAILMLTALHAVSQTVGQAVPVIVWTLVAGVVAFVAIEIAVRVLRLRYHVLHPETLTPQAVRAEVIPDRGAPAITGVPVPAVPAAVPVAALPPGTHHTWRLPNDPEAAIAVIRAIKAEGLVPGGGGQP